MSGQVVEGDWVEGVTPDGQTVAGEFWVTVGEWTAIRTGGCIVLSVRTDSVRKIK